MSFKAPVVRKRLLIVRLDAMGDYVLFRNCIAAIKNSQRFKGFEIFLLGNVVFKELAEKYDSSVVDKFIWAKPHELFLRFRGLRFLLKLKLCFFHTILNPAHARFLEGDVFLKKIGARNLIGSKGDNGKFKTKKDKALADSFYTELIDVPGIDTFEFLRNISFVENLLKGERVKINLRLPGRTRRTLNANKLNIIVVPGAGAPYRQWPAKKFASVIDILGEEFGSECNFIISGSRDEKPIAEEIKKSLKGHSISSVCGSITSSHLVELISGADLVISNETSAVHIAAATATPVVCISNGHHFGRFNYYPKEISSSVVTIYPHADFYNRSKYDELVKMYKNDRNLLDINKISVDAVVAGARQLLFALRAGSR